MSSTSGYDGPGMREEEKIPDPKEVPWKAEIDHTANIPDGSVYVIVKVGGKSIGFLRMPNAEYVRELRERLG